jgi:hypothetical protein
MLLVIKVLGQQGSKRSRGKMNGKKESIAREQNQPDKV